MYTIREMTLLRCVRACVCVCVCLEGGEIMTKGLLF